MIVPSQFVKFTEPPNMHNNVIYPVWFLYTTHHDFASCEEVDRYGLMLFQSKRWEQLRLIHTVNIRTHLLETNTISELILHCIGLQSDEWDLFEFAELLQV